MPGSGPRASSLGGCVSSLNVSGAAWRLRLCEAHFCPLGFRTGVSAASAQRLQFQGPLGSPCESAAAEGAWVWPRYQPGAPRVGPRDSVCRLEFHLGHVPCQMVSRDGVTRSQRSPPTRPHQGPENGGCRAGRDAGWLAGNRFAGWVCFRGSGPLGASSLFFHHLSLHSHSLHSSPSRPSSLTPLSAHKPPHLEGRDQVSRIWFPRVLQRVSLEKVLYKDLPNERSRSWFQA